MPASPVPAPPGPVMPASFRAAVRCLRSFPARAEISLEELPAPQRLAPWTHAVAATVHDLPGSDLEIGSGRLVLLHDPQGVTAWNGRSRYVAFVSCEVEGEIARDPLLPDVAWSWLLDALLHVEAPYTALSGTVTATSSVRFGDIADSGAPGRTDDVEIRASWTVGDDDAPPGPHIAAFTALLAVAAGLPPEGVAPIGSGRPSLRP